MDFKIKLAERSKKEDELRRNLNSGSMPIGADLMDSRLPEEEEKKFKESFSHFDDDLIPADKPDQTDKDKIDFSGKSTTIDIDRWFETDQRPQPGDKRRS